MPKKITLKELFPDVSERQLEEIAEVLHGYCAVVRRIYERLERDRPGVIDDLVQNRSMEVKVDSSKKHNLTIP